MRGIRNGSLQKEKTLGDTLKQWRLVHDEWRKKVLSYARKLKLTDKDNRRLRAILGLRRYAGPVRASDMAAMRMLARISIDAVYKYQLAAPNLRWFHITLLADEFHVEERMPTLALKRLKGKVFKAIQAIKLNGIARIDIHPLPNFPQQGNGATIMFQAHILCFTEDGRFDLRVARDTLASSRSWTCLLGAPATDITEITPAMGLACWWAGYDAKPPHDAKNRVVREDGSVRLMSTREGYRGQLAMRIVEGLAQYALRDFIFAVGEGTDLREEIWRRLMKWHRRRWQDQKPLPDFSTRKLFKRLWAGTRVLSYKAWKVLGSTL